MYLQFCLINRVFFAITEKQRLLGLLKYVYETIVPHAHVLHWEVIGNKPNYIMLNIVQNLIVNETGSTTENVPSGIGTTIITHNSPPFLCLTVVISLQFEHSNIRTCMQQFRFKILRSNNYIPFRIAMLFLREELTSTP